MKFTLFLILIVAQTCLAEEISFDYKNTSQTATILFTDDLVVRVSNVNTVDYKYTIKIEGVEGEKTATSPGGFPLPAGFNSQMGWPDVINGPDGGQGFIDPGEDDPGNEGKQQPTLDPEEIAQEVNRLFLERMETFSREEWVAINQKLLVQLEKWSTQGTVKFKDETGKPTLPSQDFSTLQLSPADLMKAARKAGKGGTVFIEISASPIFKIANVSEDKTTITIEETKNLVVEKEKIKGHLKARIYRINLTIPRRIEFALGPFVANINQTRYGKVLAYSEEADPQFQVGETDSGKWLWGLAGTWNARANSMDAKVGVGFQMGFALAGERELDKSVLGLVGCFISPGRQGSIFISAGIAGGIEEQIGGNWKTGLAIDSDQDLPVVNQYVLKGYGAVTMAF